MLIRTGGDQELRVGFCREKRRGVYPARARTIWKDEYVCEYIGKILTVEEAERRHDELEEKGDERSFIFDVKYGSVKWSVDATYEDGRIGRLINHSVKKPNIQPEVRVVDGKTHLVFFAKKDIHWTEELVYDYNEEWEKGKG